MSVIFAVRASTSEGSTRCSYAAFTAANSEAIAGASGISARICSALQTNAEPSWNSGMLVIAPFSTASPYSATEVSKRPRMSFSLVSDCSDR